MTGLLHDIALSILAAWLLGVVAHLTRQPLILAYLVGGFLVGPSGLKLVIPNSPSTSSANSA